MLYLSGLELSSRWVPLIAVLLIKILIFFFRPLSSVHLFPSNQRFETIELVDRHVLEKL